MKLLILFILTFSAATFAQSALPQYGSLDLIKGKTKYYVIADSEGREKIIKKLSDRKELQSVNSADDADFFIEYRSLGETTFGTAKMERGELSVYVKDGEKRTIAWSKVARGGQFKAAVPGELADKLVADLKKAFGK